ncbi:hypothetical protein ANCDUO_02006 [Ancylostoma duodenale]|uniref:Uncharacterized protein n=1 Tax=Ancylostoma duodenale TaxID=51022 RepID=A0A0C2H7V5_9BILA|nr:hypothetical protein ANCDUO_02006 [Ancylostoma duodenale]
MWINTDLDNDEEIEDFHMDLEKSREKTTISTREDVVVDNIDEWYDRFVQHFRYSAKSAEGSESSRAAKRRLSYETLEHIRQREAARAAGNYQLTSELIKRCRKAIKEHLNRRRSAVSAEAAEARKSIRSARRDFANRRTKNIGIHKN